MSPLMMVSLRFRFRMVSVEVGFEDRSFVVSGQEPARFPERENPTKGIGLRFKWLVYLEKRRCVQISFGPA